MEGVRFSTILLVPIAFLADGFIALPHNVSQ